MSEERSELIGVKITVLSSPGQVQLRLTDGAGWRWGDGGVEECLSLCW